MVVAGDVLKVVWPPPELEQAKRMRWGGMLACAAARAFAASLLMISDLRHVVWAGVECFEPSSSSSVQEK